MSSGNESLIQENLKEIFSDDNIFCKNIYMHRLQFTYTCIHVFVLSCEMKTNSGLTTVNIF